MMNKLCNFYELRTGKIGGKWYAEIYYSDCGAAQKVTSGGSYEYESTAISQAFGKLLHNVALKENAGDGTGSFASVSTDSGLELSGAKTNESEKKD